MTTNTKHRSVVTSSAIQSALRTSQRHFNTVVLQANGWYRNCSSRVKQMKLVLFANLLMQFLASAWVALAFDESLPKWERDMLAVWEYPVPQQFTRIWSIMSDLGFPSNLDEGSLKTRFKTWTCLIVFVCSAMKGIKSGSFALITDELIARYLTALDCDLAVVGEPFSPSPLAFGKSHCSWLN